MSNYIVSARKYRPSTFNTVVGQQALTTTLKNAIASGKLAHAYLFCGPRGVGKTTCARIFAKTINCLHPTDQGEACNACESCMAFNEQRSYNIHELDAASNNSVEDIRSLIEQVRIPPQIGRYKVFIIDEVHMLSPSAFNAFLKTLEEPPAHAIFILATTEKHKILPTILSRCQIYDFNRMDVNDIVAHLKNVADQENISYEDNALNVIAQKADGGMRDALSIFDQVVSFTNGNITYARTIENLNVLDYEYYFSLTDAFLKGEVSKILLTFNEILNKGFEGGHFISGLATHFRNLLVSRDEATLPLLEVADGVRQQYCKQAQTCNIKFLYQALKLCNTCDLNYRTSRNKRLLVEITLIEIAQSCGEEPELGQSPTKQLKPLFKTTQPATATVTTAPQPQSVTVAATPQPAPHTEQPQNNAAARQSYQAPITREKEVTVSTTDTSQANTPPSPPPPIKKLNIPSIRIRGKQTASSATQEETTAQNEKPVLGENEFAEKDLHYYWYQFANQLPQEDSAIAGRMKIMTPKLQANGSTFDVSVDNEQVQSYLLPLVPKIEAYLQQKLNNRLIQMKVHVAQAGEQVRAYSKKEQLQLMTERNPNLAKLKERFGLELA